MALLLMVPQYFKAAVEPIGKHRLYSFFYCNSASNVSLKKLFPSETYYKNRFLYGALKAWLISQKAKSKTSLRVLLFLLLVLYLR